jgi:hypothetical protein
MSTIEALLNMQWPVPVMTWATIVATPKQSVSATRTLCIPVSIVYVRCLYAFGACTPARRHLIWSSMIVVASRNVPLESDIVVTSHFKVSRGMNCANCDDAEFGTVGLGSIG